ncbi:MAG TPA: class I SAM-dependent methyltransferase [Thermoleophilaceae bacterium]|nr:class I SAM-dependent methyltransferase [Thermoleophilaceae bacterium]
MSSAVPDSDLKTRHRAMWASGDYPSMVETFLLPLGPRLVDACGIEAGMKVLDVAAGTGNASIPAAERGAAVTASDLTPELLDAGRQRAEADGLELEWVTADAESLPFEDASFDVVMSSIGAMFAPHHQDVADELVRVCRPGGTVGMLNWTPEGMIGALFRTMGPFAPPPPPGAQPPPLWGGEQHLRELFGDRVDWRTLERDNLEITAFDRPRDYGEHFKARYGPTIAARANAAKDGREGELDDALDQFCDEWNRGSDDDARFEAEYLVAVATDLLLGRKRCGAEPQRLVGQQPAAVASPREAAITLQLLESSRHGRAACANEPCDRLVSQLHRHDDSAGRDLSPAVGELREQHQQPRLESRGASDRARKRERMRAAHRARDECAGQHRPACRGLREARAEQREARLLQHVPADEVGHQRVVGRLDPRMDDVARTEQLRARHLPDHHLAAHQARHDQGPDAPIGR